MKFARNRMKGMAGVTFRKYIGNHVHDEQREKNDKT